MLRRDERQWEVGSINEQPQFPRSLHSTVSLPHHRKGYTIRLLPCIYILYIIAGIGREEPRIGWTISRRGGHCQLGGIERKKRGGEESERKKRKERKKKGNGGIVTTSGSNNGGVSGDGGSSVVKFCLYSLVMCPFDPPCAPGLRAWGTVRREGAVLRPRERERRFTGDM